MNPRILSIDCSSKVVGVSILDPLPERNARLVDFGELKMDWTKKAEADPYIQLFNGIGQIIDAYLPKHIVIESTFLGVNVVSVKVLENYRSICILAALLRGIDREHVYEYGPSQVRKAVFGDGKMDKAQCCAIMSDHFKQTLATKGYDQSDSIALALCHAKVVLKEPVPKPKKPSTRKKKA